MSKVYKAVLLGFAAALLGIAPFSAMANKGNCSHVHRDSSTFSERMEKRQAALHDALNLSSDQEGAWKTFDADMKPTFREGQRDWKKISTLPAPERMERFLAMLKEHEHALSDRIAAIKKFYGALNPEQRKVFDRQFLNFGERYKHRGT